MKLFESIREIGGDDEDFLRIPMRALTKRLPEELHGPKWDPGSLPEGDLHLEIESLLKKLRTGKVSYPFNELREDLPEGWVAAEPEQKIELDLATVYSAVPSELIEISSRISKTMEQVLDMPDYFRAKGGEARDGEPAGTEQRSPAAEEPRESDAANAEQITPIAQKAYEPEEEADRGGKPVLKPAKREPAFGDVWSGRESATASVSPTDLNTASPRELAQLPGLGKSKAAALIRYRELHGDLESIYDLLSIPGIGPRNFKGMTGLDPQKREDRDLIMRQMLGLPMNGHLLLSRISKAIAAKFNAAACILAGPDGIIVSQGGSIDPDEAKQYAALAPKIFRGTRKYLAQLEGMRPHMIALPDSQPPILFVGLRHMFMALVLKQHENLNAITADVGALSEELDWYFGKRAIVGK